MAASDEKNANMIEWVEAAQRELEQDSRARPWKATFGDVVEEKADEKITVEEESQGGFCPQFDNLAARASMWAKAIVEELKASAISRSF